MPLIVTVFEDITKKGKLNMKNKVLSRKNTEAVIEGKGSLGGVDFVMNTTVEYDGFMWHKFTLKPHAKGVTVNKLQIVIPLKKEYGDLIVPYDYTLSTTGTLTKWSGGIRPLWVGSAEKGISFVAEHSHNWGLAHSNQALVHTITIKFLLLWLPKCLQYKSTGPFPVFIFILQFSQADASVSICIM